MAQDSRACLTLEQVESSGDIVVAGHSGGSFEGYANAGGYDVVVMKLNSSGDHTLWV